MARLTEFERLRRSLLHLDALQMHAQNSLQFAGPQLIAVLTMDKSLRRVAKNSGLSPTYLSQVAGRKIVISKGAYLSLMEVLDGLPRQA